MKNKKIRKDLFLFTIVPFAIPFMVEIPDAVVNTTLKWIIIFALGFLDFYFAYKSLLEKEKDHVEGFAPELKEKEILCPMKPNLTELMLERTFCHMTSIFT